MRAKNKAPFLVTTNDIYDVMEYRWPRPQATCFRCCWQTDRQTDGQTDRYKTTANTA